ncbi:winged helix-turn-helix transcriptional regulator [Paenibacillus sp. 2003]|uniref:winged helix-turn-helix transcriptional regulator n=1 Tax=Paenibacillus TaxID=44249 RepID=UPI00286CF97F|nr:winged helix-turn-helix transcriptional regulator [Paenibacillus sp. 2003]
MHKLSCTVMRDLLKGTQRFGELRKSIPEISELGNSLKPIIFSMETWGLGYQKLNDELPNDTQ